MIGVGAYEIFFDVPIMTTPKTINLSIMTIGELGLRGSVKWSDVVKTIQNHRSFFLCPAEVGLQLRLQYLNQPIGESIFIGMQPIASDSGAMIFQLSRDNRQLILNGEATNYQYQGSWKDWEFKNEERLAVAVR